MKKQIALGAALVLAASAAYAGLKQPALVEVDLVNGFAQGDMVTAANSKNDVEFIGCGSRAFDLGEGEIFRFGFCQATDAAGVAVTCLTELPSLLDEFRAASDSSYITFSWSDDGAGNLTCTRVGFSNQSFYLEEVKSKGK